MAQHRNTATTTTCVQLPLLGNVAVYARVASPDTIQDRHQLTQVDDLRAYASELGYQAEQITVFCDEGRQAAAPILERRGYTALLAAIQAGKVNVILFRAEDRLFADATEVQVNTFIHICIERGVFVVTPHMVYDFQDLSHISQFRRQCVNAFQVIEEAVKVMQRTAGGRHPDARRQD